jgi:hypothetical protein
LNSASDIEKRISFNFPESFEIEVFSILQLRMLSLVEEIWVISPENRGITCPDWAPDKKKSNPK